MNEHTAAGRLRLNRNQLKYIAILAMLIDHIAWSFVPTLSPAGFAMHFIGRLTGPLMAYFLTEGYMHTRDVRKYALRLFVFALLSWPAFSLFEQGVWPSLSFGVIYTLFLGLMALIVFNRQDIILPLRWLIIVGLCLLSIPADWPIFDVIFPLLFYMYRKDEKRMWYSYSIMAAVTLLPATGEPAWSNLYNLGMFMVPFLIHFTYSQERGSRHPFHKWFFYVFYPAHLLILFVLKTYVF